MIFTIEDIERLLPFIERKQGFLEFTCDTIGLWEEGALVQIEGPLRAQVLERARSEQQSNPSLIDKMIGAFSGDVGQGMQTANASIKADQYWDNVKVILANSGFRRSIASLNDHEYAVLKATCVHTLAQADVTDDIDEFTRFFTQLNGKIVWAGGHGQFIAFEDAHNWPSEAQAAYDCARILMQQHMNQDTPSYEQEISEMLSQYVQVTKMDTRGHDMHHSAAAIARVVNPSSNAWATPDQVDEGLLPFKRYDSDTDLLLGVMPLDDGVYPIGFDGNESLVTIAQPGAGKTQCHILPNLLNYQGSIVALDPKLELLEQTAGYRQFQGHDVFVLNLADDDVETHRFNVMEFIDTRPDFLWGSIVELAQFLIPEKPNDNNPIFRSKAAELLATCMGGVVLEALENEITPTLPRVISRVFSATETLKNFFADTMDRAEEFDCIPLAQSAGGFSALLSNDETVEDFLRYQSNATSALMKYRGGVIDRVTGGKGDWTPSSLRKEGKTLYIRIPYEEMDVYGGFIRMVLYILTKHLRKGGTEKDQLPITFLLDEVAQLGNMDHIANVVETGRGYGLRVWMILQDEQQAKVASSKPNLILKTPKVRLFMNPTLETARDMSEELGKINEILNGTDKPIAEPSTLMGPDFKDDVVVLSSGSYPMRLQKYFAYRENLYEDMTNIPYRFERNGQPPLKQAP